MTSAPNAITIEARDALMAKADILNRVQALLDYCNSGEPTIEKLEIIVNLSEAVGEKDYAGIVTILDSCQPLLAEGFTESNFRPSF